jgi:hypothetical protein
MGASSTKSIAGSQSETKQASTRVGVAPARPSGIDGMFGGIAAMFGNEGMLRTMRAKQAENHSGQTGRKPIEAPASEAESAAARITRITFDKTSMQAIFYLEDAFGSTTETREVLDHSDPAPGVYIAQVFRDHDGRLNWRLPRGASAQPGKGFVFVAKERAPGTLAGVSQIEVHVIGGAAGEFLTTGTASRSPPMDAETRARIGEKLLQAGVTAEDVDLFLAGAGEPSLSAGDF